MANPELKPRIRTNTFMKGFGVRIGFLGLTRCVGPYFQAVEIDITPSRAERILSRFDAPQQELLGRLATIYAGVA